MLDTEGDRDRATFGNKGVWPVTIRRAVLTEIADNPRRRHSTLGYECENAAD
jgi:hypothetical protein